MKIDKKKHERTVRERIGDLKGTIDYYKKGLAGGFQKQREEIQKKIAALNADIEYYNQREIDAPGLIEKCEKQIHILQQSIKINSISPVVEKAKKVAAQLAQLKSQIADMNLSQEDLDILRSIIESNNNE